MFPTLYDCVTGSERLCSDWEASVYWWTEGNGSCDCNRGLAMGVNDIEEWTGECLGTDRFIAIDAHGDLEGLAKEDVLAAMNEDYVDG